MKKFSIFCLIAVLLFCSVPVAAEDTVPDASVLQGCNTVDGQVPFLGTGVLVSNTVSAVLYETNTDSLMYAHNADQQVSPASLVKILTALIAVEKGKMDDVVTVHEEVLATLAPDAAVVELVADEVLTVRDLLYCMMVASGNDAAVVLADHVLGSQEAFVAEMNRYAEELGCTATHFTNVHGLHDDNQYTTARDVTRILAKAVENEAFCEVFGAIYYTVPESNKSPERHISTQNYMMNDDKDVNYYDTRVTGSRTAVNNDYSRSVASVAELNDMQLICVVIGAKSQYAEDGYTTLVFGGYGETKQLLDLGFNGYRTAQILYPDQVFKQVSVVNGDCDLTIGTKSGASCVIPSNLGENDLVYRFADESGYTAPVENGQSLSMLQVWYGSVCIAQSETYAMNGVATAGTAFTNDTDKNVDVSFLRILLYVIGSVLILVFVVFIVLFTMRSFQISKRKRQSRNNSRNRRRSR